MRKEKHMNKKKNQKIFLTIGIIIVCLVVFLIVKINKKTDETDNTQKDNNEGIALYNTALGDYVKETEEGIKINTSALINSDKILENLTITDIQLTLSGHTHAGQLKIFGHSVSEIKYKEWEGIYYEGKRALLVSPGVGEALMPFRLGAWPRIDVIVLKREAIKK